MMQMQQDRENRNLRTLRREADRREDAARREEDRKEEAARRAEERRDEAAQREEERKEREIERADRDRQHSQLFLALSVVDCRCHLTRPFRASVQGTYTTVCISSISTNKAQSLPLIYIGSTYSEIELCLAHKP